MGLDSQKTLRTTRLSLTCLLLFLITWYFQIPESAWCLITIWFVMFEYSTVGGVFTKSYLRFVGTVLSALYGMIFVYFCANNPLINMMAFVPGLFLYSYFFMGGEKTYIGTIGAVTLTIVLLNYNDIDVAILRVFNIIIGILGSMFMIRFFYPQYARDKIIESQWNFMELFSYILTDYLDPSKSLATVKENYLHHEHDILEGFASFSRLISEAKIETKATPTFITHNMSAFLHVRHLFRLCSVFVNYLSTDELRLDKDIDNILSQLLFDLRAIQRKLEQIEPIAIEKVEKKLDLTSDPQSDQTIKFIKIMLTNINSEMALLDMEIDNIMQIYKVYKVKHVSVIEPVKV